jgi:FkbM family methyltransferase
MTVPRSAAQGWIPAFTGRYDDAVIDLFLSYVEPGTLVLDVGACFGFWTIPLAQSRAGAVVAVEPMPQNIDYLNRNLEANGVTSKVTVVPFVLSDKREPVRLEIESEGVGNALVATRHRERYSDYIETYIRPCVLLDDLDLPTLPCSAVKIDVEGFELHVLSGARNFIAKHRPIILGEFHPAFFQHRGEPLDQAESWAAENGYRVFELEEQHRGVFAGETIIPRPLRGQRSHGELLLLPEETSSDMPPRG